MRSASDQFIWTLRIASFLGEFKATEKTCIMSESVFLRLESLLKERGVDFGVLRHQPVFTSEEAAAVRGVALSTGAKALICKLDTGFVMFVIPADRKLESKRVRQALGVHGLRFATQEELRELTGLPPGAVPPFGSLFGLLTYCDTRLSENERINFNAGDNSISVSLRYDDYLTVENPTLGAFATQ
jgi:Ala-tRNA(Pro) deacylase